MKTSEFSGCGFPTGTFTRMKKMPPREAFIDQVFDEIAFVVSTCPCMAAKYPFRVISIPGARNRRRNPTPNGTTGRGYVLSVRSRIVIRGNRCQGELETVLPPVPSAGENYKRPENYRGGAQDPGKVDIRGQWCRLANSLSIRHGRIPAVE